MGWKEVKPIFAGIKDTVEMFQRYEVMRVAGSSVGK